MTLMELIDILVYYQEEYPEILDENAEVEDASEIFHGTETKLVEDVKLVLDDNGEPKNLVICV